MIKLNGPAFDKMLNGIGQTFKYRKSWACPCVNPASGAAKPNCPHCSGLGKIYDAEVDAVAGVAGMTVQKQWASFGRWEKGDLILSIPSNSPMWSMGEGDRVTAMNSANTFSTNVTQGTSSERLPFRVKSVSRVFWLHQQTSAIVNGKLPKIVDGAVTWPDGDGPPEARQYSITGEKYLEYWCWGEMPKNRNEHHGRKLPKLLVLKSWDLMAKAQAR